PSVVPCEERSRTRPRPRAATLPPAAGRSRPFAGSPPSRRPAPAPAAGTCLDPPAGRRLGTLGGRRRPVAPVKAALYNSHLRTLGGGEQHALAIARWLLGRGPDVDLLARPGVTIDDCDARLGALLTGAAVLQPA